MFLGLGEHVRSGARRTAPATSALLGSGAGALRCKVFVRVANAASHDLSIPATWVLASPKSLSAGVESLAFALAFQVGMSLSGRQEGWLPFAKGFALSFAV